MYFSKNVGIESRVQCMPESIFPNSIHATREWPGATLQLKGLECATLSLTQEKSRHGLLDH